MNRPRKQGTALETLVATRAQLAGLASRRLAEGGRKDEGDVEIVTADGRRWVVEAKARAALNLHDTYCRARTKAPTGAGVAVVWKRLLRKDGNARRSAAGPILVAVPLDDWLALLARGVEGE